MLNRRWLPLLFTLLAANAVAATTAFVNVNVVPMDEPSVHAGQTVIVDGDRIVAVGDVDTTPVPERATVVDGTDRYLMPGLAEMHAHVPAASSPELQRVLTLFAANGVTTIRGMLGSRSHLALRQQLLDAQQFGPRLITSGPSLNGDSVRGAEDGARQVRAQQRAGYDFIKIHPGLTLAEFEAIAAAAAEVGMPVAGHVPVAVGLATALQAGMATIDHLDGYLLALLPADVDTTGGFGGFFDVLLADQLDVTRIPELAAQTRDAGTWNVPTESLFEHRVAEISAAELASRPEMRYMPAATVQGWIARKNALLAQRGFNPEVARKAVALRRQMILALHKAGAGLLLGSDAPQVFNVPGFSLHQELAYLVEAGLTPYEALRTGTVNAAQFLGLNTGTIAPGRDADLLLLDANPLEDIRNTRRIHGVVLRGAWYPRAALQRRLAPLGRDGS